ncbi:hypothetical protein MATL_G00163220 [Megalops atlanticus]|uniref:Uncharacterized protein n=1 Tax=Megalops atlanticus TaxID=7932 RepID=A0A9D3PRQ0_MEGAT|nr:hypothetical protein MATL_G00163220 [Megalops atlanticus]
MNKVHSGTASSKNVLEIPYFEGVSNFPEGLHYPSPQRPDSALSAPAAVAVLLPFPVRPNQQLKQTLHCVSGRPAVCLCLYFAKTSCCAAVGTSVGET